MSKLSEDAVKIAHADKNVEQAQVLLKKAMEAEHGASILRVYKKKLDRAVDARALLGNFGKAK